MSEEDRLEKTAKSTTLDLKECEQRYLALFNQARDGIVLIDAASGCIVDCNPEYEKLTGRKLGQLQNMRIWELRPPEKIEAARKIFLEIKRKGKGGSRELEYQQPGGKIVPIDFLTSKVVIGGEEYLQGIVRDISKQKKIEHDLGKRFKELACLYGVSQLVAKPGIGVDEVLKETVGLIPPSWQYPEITCARITFDGREYKTGKFRATVWKQSSDIKVKGKKRGSLEVYYLEEKPKIDEGPFLKEERDLIEGLATTLSEMAEQRNTEDELREYHNRLEEMVKERTGQLTEANRRLKREVRERREAESALKKSEERFRSVFEDSSMGMVLVKRNGQYVKVNQAMSKLFGYSQKEFLSMKVSDLTYPGDIDQRSEEVRQLWAGERDGLAIEKRYLHKDGHAIWGSVWLSLTRDTNNNPQFIVGQFQDITKRKQAEKALKESEERYHSVFSEARDGITIVDRETGSIIDCNPEFEKQTGRTLKQLKEMKIWEIITPEKGTVAIEKFLEIQSSGTGGSADLEIQKPDGEIVFIEFRARQIDIQGKKYLQSISRDITEHKKADEALKKSEERYRILFNSANDAVFVHHPTPDNLPGKFFEVNDVACKMLGYSRKEMYGLSPMDIVDWDKAGLTPEEAMKNIASSGQTLYESVFIDKAGRQIPVEVNIHLFELQGQPTVLTVARDITERKKAEEKLRRGEKRIRELATAYVRAQEEERQWTALEIHDRIIQPLSAIYQHMQLVQSLVPGSPPTLKALNRSLALIKSTIRETRQVTHDLYPTTLARYGLVRLINDELSQLENQTGCQTKLSVHGRLQAPQEVETALFRVFHEALLNIRKHANASNVTVALSSQDGVVELQVRDDGVGFDMMAKTIDKVPGGLESMRRRTEILGGTFILSSRPGKGTRLNCSIPVAKESKSKEPNNGDR